MNAAGNDLADRKPAVAGQFYPSDSTELRKMLSGFFAPLPEPETNPLTAAVIVPHAGYVFSGGVAAAAFNQLNPEVEYKTVFVIGCSHRSAFAGGSVYTSGNYVTPLGTVRVDLETARKLAVTHTELSFDPGYQLNEHSIEVEIPFLQFRLKKPFKIVPILLGTRDPAVCKQIAAALKPWFTPDNLFVISTDFSHYPSYDDAVKVDKLLAEAILANDPEKFTGEEKNCLKESIPDLATGCCSWPAVLTLMYMTEKDPGLEFHKLMYRNSGDSRYGEKDRVVGYNAISVSRKIPAAAEFSLTASEKAALLSIARNTILSYLENGKIPDPDKSKLTPSLLIKAGAFVTLKKEGALRGCIGHFEADKPLYEMVQQMAVASATQDYRFNRVISPEMKNIEIEISVLSPMRKINSVKEIRLGRDGIYIKKGGRSGTFLPQVATDTGWSLEDFLGHCSRDKAGIGWDGWKDKDSEIFTYQAFVFGE